MKKTLYILAMSAVFFSCQEKKYGAFTFSGKIEHAEKQKLFLQEIPFAGDQPIIIDSTTIASNGDFILRGIGKEEGLYRMVIENGPDVLLINDAKNIKLQLDLNNYRAYKISGSDASESLHKLFETYRTKDSVLYQTFLQLDTLQKQGVNDSILGMVRTRRDMQITDMNTQIRDFINQSNSAAARYYALGMASRTMKQEEVLALAVASADKFKEHSGLSKIKSLLTVQRPETPAYPLMNKQAPEINLPDINGKPITLSSFKGKYVLVDFWASWCGPCRRENPNVVAVFNKYKDKNFTILGVSLDKEKEAWEQAIKADKLDWSHVSDLKQWESAMPALYGFDGIPFNVLVDPSGKIIATGLRGEELERKLAEVLK